MATETFTRLYVLNYNNYGNRIIKKLSTVNDYKLADLSYKAYSDINFYRGDGVNTTQTVNFAVGTAEKDGDYMLVVKVTKVDGVETNETIVSRWFIIECKYNRRNQLIFTLRRDLIVDFWDYIYTANTIFYCEKGVVPYDNNLIFNSENITLNQIKGTETLLGSGNGYIVGYLDKTFSQKVYYGEVTKYNSISEHPLYQYWVDNEVLHDVGAYYLKIPFNKYPGASAEGWMSTTRISSSGSPSSQQIFDKIYSEWGNSAMTLTNVTNIQTGISGNTTICQGLIGVAQRNGMLDTYSMYSSYNGQYFLVGDKMWQAEFTFVNSYMDSQNLWEMDGGPGWFTDILGQCKTSYSNIEINRIDETSAVIQASYSNCYRVTLKQVSSSSVDSIDLTGSRTHTKYPYDVFVAEYNATALADASKIASILYGSGALFDLQRVPYMKSGYDGASSSTWKPFTTTFRFIADAYVDASGTVSGPSLTTSGLPHEAINYKSSSMTQMWRIVSPNHANAWDFNPVQNGGVSGTWNYEYSLKPYQPYIHVYPTFGRIYGSNNTHDNRGLVCQGSFSLAVSSDHWANYQINNSSYANSFTREIENLSVTQDAERIAQKWGIVAGAVSGGISGGRTGANLGGTVGGVVGGVAGGVTSLAAGIADYEISEKLRNEAVDYKRDQFGFGLRNIQAQPNTFSQSSSFDINNAIFPFVEKYNASQVEIDALDAKLKYNGATIMAIGNFKQFYDWVVANKTYFLYLKGKLIRMPSTFKEDTHMFNEIANELYKGVYVE